MITVPGIRQSPFCDGLSRRNFLKAGALGFGGLTMADLLRAESSSTADAGRRQGSIVMVYLPGGPTQHETFDPKPNAPVEIRGAFNSIRTAVPGVHFCELLPKLAGLANRFSVIRSLVGFENRHESFQCYTGRPGGRAQDNEPSGGWPTLGSVVSRLLGPRGGGVPAYIDAAPKMSYPPYNLNGRHIGSSEISWPGFTGPQHAPFALNGDSRDDLTLNGVSPQRFNEREKLLRAFGGLRDKVDSAALDAYQKQAFDILTSDNLARAMDLSLEPESLRDRYGKAQATDNSFGGAPQDPRQFLLARRLVEAGARCVTVAFGAWDWHANREGPIDQLSKKYLPVFDNALSVFIEDLHQRGLLETTSVVVWGEFGRTPRINAKGGRDHWPNTQSVLVAGGGIRGGRVVGETDPQGGEPAERPVHVQEVFATLYRNCGIDVNTATVPDLNGRPQYLVDHGRQPIAELL